MVAAATNGQTIIKGGYANTSLLQANSIVAGMINTTGLIAENISATNIVGKDITELCELTNCELPMIQQIKTKFGTLRFYCNMSNSFYPDVVKKSISSLVRDAERKSANICEYCGKRGETRTKSTCSWKRTSERELSNKQKNEWSK